MKERGKKKVLAATPPLHRDPSLRERKTQLSGEQVNQETEQRTADHQASAEPVASALRDLQQSHGNLYVQQLVKDANSPQAKESEEGQRLDPASRAAMESAFEQDFSGVRVHDDKRAEALADDLHARAFTHGLDVYFACGEHDSASEPGKKLLAHELAHVVQQRSQSTSQERPAPSSGSGETFEQEADVAASQVMRQSRPVVRSHSQVPDVQRQEKGKKEEAPTITRHSEEINPSKVSGVVDAGGKYSVAYFYNVVNGADFVPLTLQVPSGVSVAVVPLTVVGSGDYQVVDPGGSSSRAVTISVSYHLKKLPKVQVTLTQRSSSYIVVFQFPQSS